MKERGVSVVMEKRDNNWYLEKWKLYRCQKSNEGMEEEVCITPEGIQLKTCVGCRYSL